MNKNSKAGAEYNRRSLLCALMLFAAGLLINTAGSKLALALQLPMFLDCVGTILASALGGYIPGIAVGFATNLINGIADPTSAYYGVLNVAIAVCVGYMSGKGRLQRFRDIPLMAVLLTLIGGGVGSLLTWFLYNGGLGEGISAPLAQRLYATGRISLFASQLTADLLIDALDKLVSVTLAMLVIRAIPEQTREMLVFRHWVQRPLSREERQRAERRAASGMSLRGKLLLILSTATIVIALVVTFISFIQFHQANIDQQIELARGVTAVVASNIDPDRVDEFLEKGYEAEDYREIRQRLGALAQSSPDIEYVYAYRILPDGCHVVFDPDSPDLPGEDPGAVIPFDDAFSDLLPALLAGEPIDPVISDETYGWLLTVYTPIYNAAGECVCYAAADISMQKIIATERVFLVRVIALFLGFFILIVAVSFWLAEYNITLPINSMALAASGFAYNTETAREDSVDNIRGLEIHTGDEIENLYDALTKTTEDTVRYIAEDEKKKETIAHMQNGLIMVLADLVESRDKCTGDHVRKTAAYTRIIMEQLRREGHYADQLTDEFIEDVVNSAPLHDVGKIKVEDAILNKPGRLTDDEFAVMRTHAANGGDILAHAVQIITEADSGYLREARNLAECHHEKWDGSGYPKGLKGEEIPLSARVMAVADVFDALVSDRSYKKGYSIEKSLDIIREGIGTHFDPKVAQAFLDAEDEVRRVAALQSEGAPF